MTKDGKPEQHLLGSGLRDRSLQRLRLESWCTTVLETEAHIIIPVLKDTGHTRKATLFRRLVANLGLGLVSDLGLTAWGFGPGAS